MAADDPTLGELYRIIQAHQRESEARTASMNEAIGQRVRQDVFEIVRAAQAQAVEDAKKEATKDTDDIRKDVAELAARSRRGRAEFVTWVSLALSLIAVVATVYAVTR